jgi:hypothetical protein
MGWVLRRGLGVGYLKRKNKSRIARRTYRGFACRGSRSAGHKWSVEANEFR